MRSSELFERLQNLINYKPTQVELSNVIGVKQSVIGNRAARNSNYSDEEIEMIEEFYAISLRDNKPVDCVEIEYISITPSCGRGEICLADADVTPVKIGKELIKNFWNTKPENLKLFKASGDSMESSIEDGNVLLVDISKTDYHNGGIYIIQINNDWFCKRLRLRITGELDIISDNTKYPMETLTPNTDVEIKVIGRVIKNLSRGL